MAAIAVKNVIGTTFNVTGFHIFFNYMLIFPMVSQFNDNKINGEPHVGSDLLV